MSYTESLIESNISMKRCQMQCVEVGASQLAVCPYTEKVEKIALL